MHPQYHLKKEQQQNKNKTHTNEVIMDRFIIYTQLHNNAIIIGDINTGNIIRECAIPNVYRNNDVCIWNKLPPSLIPHNENINVNEKALMLNSNNNISYYLIVASYDDSNNNNHSINILNFEAVVLTKKAIKINDKNAYPTNLLKTKVSSYLSENEKILEESKKEGKGVGSSKFPSNAQEQKYKEVIVQFNGDGDYSSIYLFE